MRNVRKRKVQNINEFLAEDFNFKLNTLSKIILKIMKPIGAHQQETMEKIGTKVGEKLKIMQKMDSQH